MEFMVHQSSINSINFLFSSSPTETYISRHNEILTEETVAYYHGDTFGNFKWTFYWSRYVHVDPLAQKAMLYASDQICSFFAWYLEFNVFAICIQTEH